MKAIVVTACALAVLAAGCDRGARSTQPAAEGVRQTKFPGQVTAGGSTSGAVIAATQRATDASYAGGTPGIAGGAGGTTGGAKLGGTVAESGHAPSGTNTKPPAAKQTPSGQ